MVNKIIAILFCLVLASFSFAAEFDADSDGVFDSTYKVKLDNLVHTATTAISANVITMLSQADFAGIRTQLSLVPGTNVQAYNANLAAFAGMTFADASVVQLTGEAAGAVLTSGGANRFLKSNSDNSALEFAVPTLASFTGQTAWRIFYSDGNGDVTELALGSDGEYLKSNGASLAPSWATPSGAAHDAVTLSAAAGSNLLSLSTQEIGLDTQTANYVFAGPTSGNAAAPAFRALVAADLPTASDSAQGASELATDAETVTGAATNRVVTPANLTARLAAPGAIGGTTPAAGNFTSVTVVKSSGTAGDLGLYEANSTDTHAAGFRGPASITGDGAYRGQFPNARPDSANMVQAWTNAGESGSGTASDPYVQAMSWVDLDLYLLISEIDDEPVNGATGVPISSNWAYDHAAAADPHAGYVLESLYDAQTIIHATSDNTPVALTVSEQTVVGRATGGNIAALAIDADISSVSANDDTVPSAKATKAYADSTTVTAKNYVTTAIKSSAYTIGTDNANEAYGGVIYVTSAATITAPAVAAGMSFTVITIGATAVSVDVNASDRMYLDGVLLDDGDKATNTSTAGDVLVCTYYSADGWYCISGSNDGDKWTDGGA